jgi:predicted nucleic acid-binding protein
VKTPILYLDTSVIGGYFDDEFKEATRELWRQMEAGKYRFVTSTITADELAEAPVHVRDLWADTFTPEMILDVTDDMDQLAAAYMAQKVVPAKYEDDALHVAIAVVGGIQVIVSWNFKHLVNFQREAGFNGVNLLQGYPSVRILSPLELIYDDEEKDF